MKWLLIVLTAKRELTEQHQ